MEQNAKTCLVYFSIGKNPTLEYRTVFSILSFFCFNSNNPTVSVVVFTDHKEAFTSISGKFPVTCVLLTDAEISLMKGEIDFIHRVKIGIIEKAFLLYNCNVLYLDSDTFFMGKVDELLHRITPQQSVTHIFEYPIKDLSEYGMNDPHGLFYDSILNRQILISDRQIKPGSDFNSWNAGVLGIHQSNAHLLKAVYEFTDQLYPYSGSHACEQYAFSYVLETNTTISTADKVIFHYWHRVNKQIADLYIAGIVVSNSENSDKRVEKLIQKLPLLFENHRLKAEYLCLSAFWKKEYKVAYKKMFDAFFKGSIFNPQFLRDLLFNVRLHLKN